MPKRRKKSILDKIEPLADIEAVQMLHKEMRALCLQAGVLESHYKNIIKLTSPKNNDEENDRIIRDVRNFLIEFYIREYTDYKKEYELLPPHVWENYKLIHEIENMPEQIALRNKARTLRDAWSRRPKRKKIKVEE